MSSLMPELMRNDFKHVKETKRATLDGYQKPIPASVLLRRPELRFRGSNLSPHSELYVTARIWADSKPLTVSVQTAYKVFKTERRWNEWLTLPIAYANLPLNALLALTIWDLSPSDNKDYPFHSIPFGGTTIPLFDTDNTLRKGRQRCRVYRNREADGFSTTSTPHESRPNRYRDDDGKVHEEPLSERERELARLEDLMKKLEMNEIPANEWLDQMVYRQIAKLQRAEIRDGVESSSRTREKVVDNVNGEALTLEQEEFDPGIFNLYIEFPRFDHPIVYTDHEYPPPPISTMHSSQSEVRLRPPPEVSFGPGIDNDGDDPTIGRLVRIYDPEIGIRDNPAESKHRRLVRSHRTGVFDRDLKPNAKIRDELNTIMSYGPTHELNSDDKDLIWRFRHHLTREKRALTKFIKSVAWNDQSEARQAVLMLPKWTEIDVDDALELLGPNFDNPAVREYAVDRLRKADDEELLLYLLQLVQALKFERVQAQSNDDPAAEDSSLARFLVTRAADSFLLGNYLHWYLMVECSDNSPDQADAHRKLFAKIEYDFMTELLKRDGGEIVRDTIRRQSELVAILTKLAKDVRDSREDRPRRIDKLKKYLADPRNGLTSYDPPLPLPLDPTVLITGIDPSHANVMKSSLSPYIVSFKTSTGSNYNVLFKMGDDLRQDQLVIQIITLMDRLLRKENLDLKLTPYRVLATAPQAGGMQFIKSTSVSGAVSKHKSILNYLKSNNPDSSEPLGVRRQAMDTYVKSVAGYCVITFLLGVGDRHSENLLITPDGHFFHADFGYILGRDPKPFAPLFKLSREMIDGMGGIGSAQWTEFKQYCFTAYTALRKNASLILNLFALMNRANIQDIRFEPDKAVDKVRERFHLELSEEEAGRYFEQVTHDMVGAFMPAMIDQLHGLVQRFRT